MYFLAGAKPETSAGKGGLRLMCRLFQDFVGGKGIKTKYSKISKDGITNK